jgi:hypothetical protein
MMRRIDNAAVFECGVLWVDLRGDAGDVLLVLRADIRPLRGGEVLKFGKL